MSATLHLVDRLTELVPFSRVRAIRAPSYGEQLFEDHFAGFPIVPGALMVEAMVQSAQWLARASHGFPVADFRLKKLERAVFSDYVRPGSVMEIDVEQSAPLAFRGTIRVTGKKVASIRFELERHDLDGTRLTVRRGMERLEETFDRLGGPGLLGAGEREH